MTVNRTESARAFANFSTRGCVLPVGMGTDNVISLADRRAAKLTAEVAAPAVILEPLSGETVDEFVERVGNAIAEAMDRRRRYEWDGAAGTPSTSKNSSST